MLQSLWELLGNFGVDLDEIAQSLASVIAPVVDPDTGDIIGYAGSLAPLVEVPVIGDVIKSLADLVAENMPGIE